MATITVFTFEEKMFSFQRLWEQMEELDELPTDDKAMSAIRTGNGVSDTFWNNFLQVINNSDGLSELLDVPVEKIIRWREKIKDSLEKIEKQDKPKVHKKNKMLSTGHPSEEI
jgi:hypothetical protein